MPGPNRNFQLNPGQWTKVYWAWGYGRNLGVTVSGTGFPMEVDRYSPFYSGNQKLPTNPGTFQFTYYGYGDFWLRSAMGGNVSLNVTWLPDT